MQTCGIDCPVCECCDADILEMPSPKVLQLSCQECRWEWWVDLW